MTERAITNPGDREQLADLQQRIQALSALQEEFYRSEDFRRVDFAAFVERLAESLAGLSRGRVRLALRLEAMELPVDLTGRLGRLTWPCRSGSLPTKFPPML